MDRHMYVCVFVPVLVCQF